jgi:aminopeptidase YwaD
VSYKSNFSKFVLLSFVLSFSQYSLAQKPRFKEKKVAKNLESHVTYLASDELEGRLTASAGEATSAAYIESEFKAIGLEPAGNYGYYHNLSVASLRMAQSNSSLLLDDKVLTLFTDFFPMSESANNGIVKGEAINVGYGIQDAGLKVESYTGKDVRGKIVLINIDIPGGQSEHNRFMTWIGTSYRIQYAKSKGARAVIFYSANKELYPSGTLEKIMETSGMPVLFVKKDLSETKITSVDLTVDIMLLTTEAHNVLGYIDNGAPSFVIISANHDHLGISPEGKIYNGAADNASGVAAMLELAKKIKANPKHFKNNNYMFIAFTGKEQDLLGSDKLGRGILKPNMPFNYSVNLDNLGHLDSTKTLQVYGTGNSPTWDVALGNVRYAKRKVKGVVKTEALEQDTDAFSFYRSGFPSILFTTGNIATDKTTEDVASLVNYAGESFVVSYIYRFLCTTDRLCKQKKLTDKDGVRTIKGMKTIEYREVLKNNY